MSTNGTAYPNLRENLNPDFARRSDKSIEAAFERLGVDAEAAEGFFDDIGSFAKKLAPSVLPVAGSLLGGVVGGPIGASLGGSLGSFAGKAIGGGGAAAAPAAPAAGVAGMFGGSPAAGQLLQTIAKPETMQAVASMAMGAMGKPNVSVGGTEVPVSAFGNLLKILTGRMEAEYHRSTAMDKKDYPEYMQDYAGEAKSDPAVAENRAAALYELLQFAESEREASEAAESGEAVESEAAESETEAIEAEYDAIELIEVYESEEA